MIRRKQPPGAPAAPENDGPALTRELMDDLRGATLEAGSRQWYRDQYRRMVAVTLGALGLCALSLGFNILQATTRPEPRYFAFTSDFRLKEMPSLSDPLVSDAALLNWVAETVSDTLTLDFKEWRTKLLNKRDSYDPAALNQLADSLTSSTGFVTLLLKERLVSSAVVQSPPLITAQGIRDGVHAWKIEFPVDLAFESSKGLVSTQRLIAQVIVSRVDTLSSERGIVISQLVLGPR